MAAKNKFMNAMKMPAIADMFSSEADRQRESGDLVTVVPLSELHPFVNHPFEVRDDEDMQKLVDSIKENGVLTNLTVRPRAEGGYEGVEIEAEGRESGEYDRKSQHPNYYAAKKRVNGRVNALSLKPLYQQLAYKGADPEAERDYYCRSDEFGQRVNELRYKCFKVKCRKFFSHSFFLRFEYDLL